MLKITPIPAFSDNYIWLIQGENSSRVVVVDPGDARPVLKKLESEQLELAAILVTHHHADHIGGIQQLKQKFPDIQVFGPENESIPSLTHKVKEGDAVYLEDLQAQFTVMSVPGHTSGHIVFYGEGVLFCGDTLFACGCGRVFEGTMQQMQSSVARIATLPAATRIYCAHEYTLDNIGFAKWVEPDNQDLLKRDAEDMARQEKGIPTVPSTLEMELKTNPFLRYEITEVIRAAEKFAGKKLSGNAEVFAAIRKWKDTEYD